MRDYQAYILDQHGHIKNRIDIEAADLRIGADLADTAHKEPQDAHRISAHRLDNGDELGHIQAPLPALIFGNEGPRVFSFIPISTLRKALEEGSGGNSYVLTDPGRGYRLVGVDNGPAVPSPSNMRDTPARGTSVAVLRFANLSGDASQNYFADGIVEDIITGLSRITGLSVVGSTSSLLFEAEAADLASVGRKLGCRYLVQGSVRKADNRIRITARLVESESGAALWAERYDRRFDDIFEVQDAIAMSLIGALEPNLRKVEINRVRRERPNSLDAYDLVLRAISSMRSTMPTGAGTA